MHTAQKLIVDDGIIFGNASPSMIKVALSEDTDDDYEEEVPDKPVELTVEEKVIKAKKFKGQIYTGGLASRSWGASTTVPGSKRDLAMRGLTTSEP